MGDHRSPRLSGRSESGGHAGKLVVAPDAGLRRGGAAACARLGFTGKASIHPNQIPIINEAFTPDEKTIAKARKVCAAFEQDKTGLVVVDGELIELPVVRSMYRVLAIASRVTRAA